MLDIKNFPKSIKKAIQFIKQDASLEQLGVVKINTENEFIIRNGSLNEDILIWNQG